jgi:hypothetical protein
MLLSVVSCAPLSCAVRRARYVAALQAADNHDIGPLFEFARS